MINSNRGAPSAGAAGLTAQAVADLVGGRLLGDGAVLVRRVRTLDEADDETLSLAVSRRYADELRASRAAAVLVPEALADVAGGPSTKIVVRQPYHALARVLEVLYPSARPPIGIDPTVRLGLGAEFGADVTIGAFTLIGRNVRIGARCRIAERVSLGDDVVIGDDTVIDAGVVCYTGTSIGRRVVVKANAVIGGPGFGFVSDASGHRQLPHVGGCILEDDVQIGSQTCIDRGSIGNTVIGPGTKIDNLVHIAHNVRIGAHCLLMAGSGTAGSVTVGDRAILAGHVGVSDHVEIGAGARIGAKSAVFGNVAAGADVSGHPARPHRQVLRAQAALLRLAPIVHELERLVGKQTRDNA